jgi:hypothetical protein
MAPFRARSRGLAGWIAILLFPLAAWSVGSRESPALAPSPPALERDAYYSVEVDGPVTRLVISAEAPCDLILGSLGRGAETYRVRMTATVAPTESETRLQRVEPLHWKRLDPRESNSAAKTVETEPAPPSAASAVETERSFWLNVADTPLEDPRGYTEIRGRVVARGKRACVYADRQLTEREVDACPIDEIVRLLDERIIPRSGELIGTADDIDHDGRLGVLLTPWLSRLQGGRTSVNGFVRCQDFDPRGAIPFSNRADVMYINATLAPGTGLAALLAHEYTHAVCCSLRQAAGASRFEEDWLNEAIAHVAENLHGADWSNLSHRVGRYLEAPGAAPLVVSDYYRGGLWRDDGVRGATYLFLRWCVDGAGDSLIPRLSRGPDTGIANLESATGTPFDVLYRHWTIDLHRGRGIPRECKNPSGKSLPEAPRIDTWRCDDGPREVTLRGTSTAYVRIVPPPGAATLRVVLEAEPKARLQATITRARESR